MSTNPLQSYAQKWNDTNIFEVQRPTKSWFRRDSIVYTNQGNVSAEPWFRGDIAFADCGEERTIAQKNAEANVDEPVPTPIEEKTQTDNCARCVVS